MARYLAPFMSFLLLLSHATTAPAAGPAGRLYVNQAVSTSGDGLSWANAYRELQEALQYADSHPGAIGEIWVAAGTYKPASAGADRNATFALPSAVAVFGGFAGSENALGERDLQAHPTVLSGDLNANDATQQFDDNVYNVVTATNRAEGTALDGLVVSGGRHLFRSDSHGGAGIRATGGYLALRNCTIRDNWIVSGGTGGGVFAQGVTLVAENCLFTNNKAGDLMTLNEIGGGGVKCIGGTSSFTHCSFLANGFNATVFGYGGGAWVSGNASFQSCEFADNQRAGLFVDQDSVCTVVNCLLVRNELAAIITDSDLTIQASTIADNVPCSVAGGMLGAPTAITLTNCIVKNNIFCGSSTFDLFNCLYDSVSTLSVVRLHNCINADPLFISATDYHLQPQSPCIDTGVVIANLLTDFEGDARGYGSGFDMGYDEASYPLLRLQAPDAYASEPGSNTGRGQIVREGNLTSSLPVTLQISGSAINGADYRTVASTVTMKKDSALLGLPVTPLDDPFTEGLETVVFSLVNSPLYRVINRREATVTILDNEDPAVIQVTLLDADASEPINPGVFRISRTGYAFFPQPVFFAWSGTATKSIDYSAPTSPVVIPAYCQFVHIKVSIRKDRELEHSETVTLTIAQNDSYLLGASNNATLTIRDYEDTPAVSVQTIDPIATETSGGTNGRFRFTRTGSTESPLVLSLVWSGTAGGADYVKPWPVTIPSGSSFVDVFITPKEDSYYDPDETVIVRVVPTEEYHTDDAESATVTIQDNDIGLTVGVIDGEIGETGDNQATLRICSSRIPDYSFSVGITWSGTASRGVDYTARSSPVTFPAGASFVDLTITQIPDEVTEGEETVTLRLLRISSKYDLGSPSSVTLHLKDTGQ